MPVYLDYAATTSVCPEAVHAACEAMTEGYGNPSSGYGLGQEAASALKADRGVVAEALGCLPEELIFTSCGTESNNWAITAAVKKNRRKGRHIITTAIEHAAVLEPCKALAAEGYEVTYLKPDRSGHASVEDLTAALRPDTVLVSMMLVNNELGTVQPVAEAVRAVKAYDPDILFHTDAVQGFLKIPVTPSQLGVDLLTVSGHKIHAPKGIGALYIKKGVKIKGLLLGGGQEGGLRSGTEPTAQIAAFAAACRVGRERFEENVAAMNGIKEYSLSILSGIPGLEVVSNGEAPHILAVSLPGYPSQMMVQALDAEGICVSSGSACHKGKASHVFEALKLPPRVRMGVLRVSFDTATTREEIDTLALALKKITSERVAAM
ncbi:MAG: cysteine desulfurase [Oscillospiraceae bacterium]|nr:cysteine desulfurase [Oscillospiraceae bacterium]